MEFVSSFVVPKPLPNCDDFRNIYLRFLDQTRIKMTVA